MSAALDAELRRLAFSFEKDLISAEYGGQQMQVAYHLSLSRFLLRSLADLYPELPVGSFSKLVVFSVKDEVGVLSCPAFLSFLAHIPLAPVLVFHFAKNCEDSPSNQPKMSLVSLFCHRRARHEERTHGVL